MATIKVEHNAIYWASIILTVLFAWIIYPYKWIRLSLFKHKRSRAIAKAKRQSRGSDAIIYVVQWNDTFFIGKRNELRQIINQYYAKRVHKQYYAKRVHKQYSHKLDVDFRNAVIAKCRNGQIIKDDDTRTAE